MNDFANSVYRYLEAGTRRSTRRPLRRSVSPCRRCSWRKPTRSSNEIVRFHPGVGRHRSRRDPLRPCAGPGASPISGSGGRAATARPTRGWRRGCANSAIARATVITDEGFPDTAELFRERIGPQPDRVLMRHAGTAIGDGLKMAEAAGAATIGLNRFYGHLLSRDTMDNPRLWPYPQIRCGRDCGNRRRSCPEAPARRRPRRHFDHQ